MRTPLLVLWLLLPLGGWAFHEGPGQDLEKLDKVDGLLRSAHSAATDGKHAKAVADLEAALASLPAESTELGRHIRLERAKSMMHVSKLPVARGDLEELVDELERDPKADSGLLADARSTLANAAYYVTWLMRLEGKPREVWEPEIDGARQQYRLLAEAGIDPKRTQKDLEAAVVLSRLEIQDLQGLPLPGQ
ncbi:MAG: hypothetical protein AB7I19_12155 [Planctomycetota bacterium]